MQKKSISGKFKPETVNLDERTVEVSFTTGEGGRRIDWHQGIEYIEELAVDAIAVRTGRLDKGLSVLDSHNVYNGIDDVFGITEDYRFENGELLGTVRFAEDELSDARFKKIASGILRHVSLGYKVHKYLKSRGEDDKLPTYLATDWEPTELSFVPVSFETTNGVRAGQRENEPTYMVEIEETNMNKQQLARLAFLQGSATRTAEEEIELTNLIALRDSTVAAPAASATPNAQTVRIEVAPAAPTAPAAPAAVNREDETPPVINRDEIETETRKALGIMVTACDNVGLNRSFADKAFADGKNVDQFRELLIAEMANADSEYIVNNHGVELNSDNRSDAKQVEIEAATNALMVRSGNDDGIEINDTIRKYVGLPLLQMGQMFAGDSGQRNLIGASPLKLATRALHTGSDFPLILENVMNKSLNIGYVETPQTFRDLGRKTTHNDFRERHTYTLGDAPNLLPLGELGEYKAGTFSEGKEKYGLATYARKIGFSRQMLINDDMGALDRMPMMFGAAASRLESNIIWGLLLGYDFFTNTANPTLMNDGNELFSVAHGNLLEAGSAMSETALSALRLLGRKQKTLDGNFMNIAFNELVIPEDLETTAEKLLQNNFVAAKSADTNSFINKLKFRIEPRLAAVSTSAYLAFTSNKTIDTFEYAYLAGEEQMMVEVVNSHDADGMEVKVRHDFGGGVNDSKGMARATGAA